MEEPTPICVRVYQRPFDNSDVIFAEVDRGLTLVEITGRADLPAIIIADGRVIDCEEWSTYIPTGDVVIRRIPAGDSGRLIGTIAVLALAVWAGPAAMLAIANSGVMMSGAMMGFGGALISGALGIAGPIALNSSNPPAVPNEEKP